MQQMACVPGCQDASRCELRSRCAYGRIFAPAPEGAGPSGFADSPRPFVFRAGLLDGMTLRPGDRFCFDLHVFLARNPELSAFVLAFEQLADEGLGPGRGKAQLESVWQLNGEREPSREIYRSGAVRDAVVPLELPLDLPLTAVDSAPDKLLVRFVTPTELKADKGIVSCPEFHVLFGRARDRISTLRSLYGGGPLALDFQSVGDRARRVSIVRTDLKHIDFERRSSRTGQTHPLGGLIGEVEYAGDFAEFIPILRAAEWTGVGRQTVWGKGEIRCLGVR